MEQDRYLQNTTPFVLGMVTLLLSLILFTLGFYLLPYLLWGWRYKVPGFVIDWHEWLKQYHAFTDIGASWLIFFSFIIPGLICGTISHWASNYIDTQVCDIHEEKIALSPRVKRDIKDSLNLAFKIILLILLILIGLVFMQWLLSVPPPAV